MCVHVDKIYCFILQKYNVSIAKYEILDTNFIL